MKVESSRSRIQAARGHRASILNTQYAILNLKRWLPLIAWLAFIFYMSSQPKPPPIPLIEGLLDRVDWSDKIKHFAGYAVLGALMWRSLGEGCSRWRRFWLAIALSAVYGATDEFHQRFTPGRSCDFYDWTADVIGASVGAIIMLKGGGKTWQKKASKTKATK